MLAWLPPHEWAARARSRKPPMLMLSIGAAICLLCVSEFWRISQLQGGAPPPPPWAHVRALYRQPPPPPPPGPPPTSRSPPSTRRLPPPPPPASQLPLQPPGALGFRWVPHVTANATGCLEEMRFPRKCRWCKKSKSSWCKRLPAVDLVECSRICSDAGTQCTHAVFREPHCYLKTGSSVPLSPQPCEDREDHPRLVAVRERVEWFLTSPQPQCPQFDKPEPPADLPAPPMLQSPPLEPWMRGAEGAEPEPCVFLIDRHVHKNGGSTMRELFLANEARGECIYWGYSAYGFEWRSVKQSLLEYLHDRSGQAEGGGSPAPTLRICAEVHYPAGGFNVTELSELRSQLLPAPTLRPTRGPTRARHPCDPCPATASPQSRSTPELQPSPAMPRTR